ncbi:TPA: hypothetical protein DCX16_02345 [bacterium]|nr:hypothetical protein [bacterium]
MILPKLLQEFYYHHTNIITILYFCQGEFGFFHGLISKREIKVISILSAKGKEIIDSEADNTDKGIGKEEA